MNTEQMKRSAFTGFKTDMREVFRVNDGNIEFAEGVTVSELQGAIAYMVMVIDRLSNPGGYSRSESVS